MWRYKIFDKDGHVALKRISMRDLMVTVKAIKADKRYKDQKLTKPRITLLIKHVMSTTYNLQNVSSITIDTTRRSTC